MATTEIRNQRQTWSSKDFGCISYAKIFWLFRRPQSWVFQFHKRRVSNHGPRTLKPVTMPTPPPRPPMQSYVYEMLVFWSRVTENHFKTRDRCHFLFLSNSIHQISCEWGIWITKFRHEQSTGVTAVCCNPRLQMWNHDVRLEGCVTLTVADE